MTGPELIYIIEDDPLAGFLAELIIKKEQPGSRTKLFGNSEWALESIRAALGSGTALPDLILLDLNMPMLDGWDFLEALNALPAGQQVPVFVLTSSIRPDDMERAKHYPQVRGYFAKPLDESMLREMRLLLAEG